MIFQNFNVHIEQDKRNSIKISFTIVIYCREYSVQIEFLMHSFMERILFDWSIEFSFFDLNCTAKTDKKNVLTHGIEKCIAIHHCWQVRWILLRRLTNERNNSRIQDIWGCASRVTLYCHVEYVKMSHNSKFNGALLRLRSIYICVLCACEHYIFMSIRTCIDHAIRIEMFYQW